MGLTGIETRGHGTDHPRVARRCLDTGFQRYPGTRVHPGGREDSSRKGHPPSYERSCRAGAHPGVSYRSGLSGAMA